MFTPTTRNAFSNNFDDDYDNDSSQISSTISTTSVSNFSQQADESNSLLVHTINELKWLSISDNIQPSITLNETDYQILLDTVSYH